MISKLILFHLIRRLRYLKFVQAVLGLELGRWSHSVRSKSRLYNSIKVTHIINNDDNDNNSNNHNKNNNNYYYYSSQRVMYSAHNCLIRKYLLVVTVCLKTQIKIHVRYSFACEELIILGPLCGI